MIDPVQSQSVANVLLNADSPTQRKLLPVGFPMQNLATYAEDAAVTPKAATNRISLTPQSFASIITKSIIEAVQSVMAMFLDKIMELSGIQKASSSEASESTGTSTASGAATATNVSGSTSTAGSENTQPSGPLETVKELLKKVGEFFFGENGGIGQVIKDLATSVLSGGTLKLDSIWKNVKNIWKAGKDLLGGAFESGKDLLSGLWKSGKKMLSKIF